MASLFAVYKSAQYQLIFPIIGALLLAVGIMLSTSSVHAATLIEVPAGDSGALLDAIRSANQSSEVAIIRLESGADFHLNLSESAPEPVSSHVILLGGGSQIVGQGNESFGQLFNVLEQGILEVSDLVIRDFESDEERGQGLILNSGLLIGHDLRVEHIRSRSSTSHTNAIFENYGQLELNRVRIADVTVHTSEIETAVILAIANRGDAQLENVLIVDGKGLNSELANPFGSYIRNINFGKLEVYFSSLILESMQTGAASDVQSLIRNPVRPGQYVPGTTISASIIFGFECPFKQPDVSGGFNVVSADDCLFPSHTDRLGVPPQALQFRLHSDGGLKVVLPPNSPAVDRVNKSALACPGHDAIGSRRPIDGNHDGRAFCDAGAFEYSGGNRLFAGGENGLFYSAGADGHYVTIQEVRPKEYVIYWNTFDLNGDHVWVFGVGNRDGDIITADGYYQSDGVLVPGGGADVNTDAIQNWGTLSIQLENCLEGEFSYDSVLPQFGSGSFEIDRLAYVNDLGCQD